MLYCEDEELYEEEPMKYVWVSHWKEKVRESKECFMITVGHSYIPFTFLITLQPRIWWLPYFSVYELHPQLWACVKKRQNLKLNWYLSHSQVKVSNSKPITLKWNLLHTQIHLNTLSLRTRHHWKFKDCIPTIKAVFRYNFSVAAHQPQVPHTQMWLIHKEIWLSWW